MIQLLANNKKYVIELDESTATYWCVREVGLEPSMKVVFYPKHKMWVIPETLNGALVGFHSYASNKQNLFEKIEKLRIPYIISKRY